MSGRERADSRPTSGAVDLLQAVSRRLHRREVFDGARKVALGVVAGYVATETGMLPDIDVPRVIGSTIETPRGDIAYRHDGLLTMSVGTLRKNTRASSTETFNVMLFTPGTDIQPFIYGGPPREGEDDVTLTTDDIEVVSLADETQQLVFTLPPASERYASYLIYTGGRRNFTGEKYKHTLVNEPVKKPLADDSDVKDMVVGNIELPEEITTPVVDLIHDLGRVWEKKQLYFIDTDLPIAGIRPLGTQIHRIATRMFTEGYEMEGIMRVAEQLFSDIRSEGPHLLRSATVNMANATFLMNHEKARNGQLKADSVRAVTEPANVDNTFSIFDFSRYVGRDIPHAEMNNPHVFFSTALTTLRYLPQQFLDRYADLTAADKFVAKEMAKNVIDLMYNIYPTGLEKILPELPALKEALHIT